MKNPKHSKALQEWLAADERLFRAHQRIRATFLESEFSREAETETKGPRPCINVTPPKPPPKK